MKYKDWLNEWLSDYQKNYLKPRTYRNYEGIVKNHITPLLGEYDLSELSLPILHEFIVDRQNCGRGKNQDGLSSGSIEIIINVLQKSLGDAVEMGKTENHYANKLKRPRSEYGETECFSVSEQKAIEEYILSRNPNKKIGIIICLYTGLRIGELLALRWSDVDFLNNTVRVSHTARDTYIDGKRETVLDTPKTQSSKRVIPIPNQLMHYLVIWKRESKCEFIIATKGGATTSRSYQKLFMSILKKLNIKHRGFHTLRHTFATRALECGVDVKTLSEIMGHKSPTITLNRYAHSMNEHKIAMMNKIGEGLDVPETYYE